MHRNKNCDRFGGLFLPRYLYTVRQKRGTDFVLCASLLILDRNWFDFFSQESISYNSAYLILVCVLFAFFLLVCFFCMLYCIVCFSSTTFASVPLIIGRQLVELCIFLATCHWHILFGIPSATHSFFPGLKPSFSTNLSHCSPSFLST